MKTEHVTPSQLWPVAAKCLIHAAAQKAADLVSEESVAKRAAIVGLIAGDLEQIANLIQENTDVR